MRDRELDDGARRTPELPTRLIAHDVVDSTSERAFAALADGSAQHGDVHTAREQTAGRGRRGASWHSAPGEGLYFSIVLLPGHPIRPAALTIAGGLAVHDAVRELGLEHATLKWPNDVLFRAAKLAGVLVETRGLDPAHPHYVAGIGLNVRQRAFPRELTATRTVTSLALAGIDTSIERARDCVLRAFASRYESILEPTLARDFLVASRLQGAEVEVALAGERVCGRVVELTVERGLVLLLPDDQRVAFPLEHVRQVTRAGD